ncbi:MAG: enoyl-CoA hydratase/isomerase family protein [Hyphomicrobiales bacterium]
MSLVEYAVEDRIATIRMNRPERLNAMSREMREELVARFQDFIRDDNAWVGILTGTGRGFCAGRDLKAQAAGGAPPTPVYTDEWNLFGIANTDKPLIAAVNGYAIGAGWYMAAGCDIRVAAESAKFGMGEVPTGVLGPYWFPVAEVLPWCVGAEITLLGENLPASRLLELGLVNEVVPDERLMDAALRWARKFVALPPLHVRKTKELMMQMRNIPSAEMLQQEADARSYLNALDDTREAAAAFAEKRAPQFQGR